MTGAAIKGKQIGLWVLVALVVLALIGLGTWQLQRRAWKLGLIERIEHRAYDEPISLTLAKEHWQSNRDVEYYRVVVVGHFLNDEERHLYAIEDGQAGWRIITPLATSSGDDIVLVDRGFVPEDFKAPATRTQGQIGDSVELVGLARASSARGWFIPAPDIVRNRWFSRDIPAMAASLPGDQAGKVTPFMLAAEAEPVPGGWPRSGATVLTLPNSHLAYAMTWYGLALTLLIVAFFLARSRAREAAQVAATGYCPERPRSIGCGSQD